MAKSKVLIIIGIIFYIIAYFIVASTHMFILFNGLPPDAVFAHAMINMLAVVLFAIAAIMIIIPRALKIMRGN